MAILQAKLFEGLIIGAVITAVYCFFYKAIIAPFRRQGELEKAKAEGRCVEAKKIKNIYPKGLDEVGTESYIVGIYEYEVDGRKYKYKGNYCTTPPATQILYYGKNPAKATNRLVFGNEVTEWKKVFVISSICGFVFALIFLG